jgi:hypothetical protein
VGNGFNSQQCKERGRERERERQRERKREEKNRRESHDIISLKEMGERY